MYRVSLLYKKAGDRSFSAENYPVQSAPKSVYWSASPFQPAFLMSDDESQDGVTPIQLGKRTLDAIIEGVAAKLRDSPPTKRSDTGKPGESSGATDASKGGGEQVTIVTSSC